LIVVAIDVLSSILLPFGLGIAIAFFLNPLVKWMVRRGLPRAFAAFLVLLAFGLVMVSMAILLVPLLEAQVVKLLNHFPEYLGEARERLDQLLEILQNHLSSDDVQRIRDAATASISDLLGGIGSILTRLLTGGVAVANLLSLVVVTPIVTFYFLRDWDRIMALLDGWIPRAHLHTVREQAHQISDTLSGFLRGQALVCLILGSFYAVGLSTLGIESGLVIGLCVGFFLFIPVLGGLTGGLISMALAFAQYGSSHKPLYVLLLFVVGQTIEANVLTPKLIGDKVHLHPVWVIFALLAFGVLFGFVGVLTAVPLAAVIGVLMRFAVRQYLLSPLYDPLNGPRGDAAA
jgi:predicted PurR-regulated permease PerM